MRRWTTLGFLLALTACQDESAEGEWVGTCSLDHAWTVELEVLAHDNDGMFGWGALTTEGARYAGEIFSSDRDASPKFRFDVDGVTYKVELAPMAWGPQKAEGTCVLTHPDQGERVGKLLLQRI